MGPAYGGPATAPRGPYRDSRDRGGILWARRGSLFFAEGAGRGRGSLFEALGAQIADILLEVGLPACPTSPVMKSLWIRAFLVR